MEIRVLAFGAAKEIVGSTTIVVATSAHVTVAELMGMLKTNYPALNKLSALAIAVNGAYAKMDAEVTGHDEVAIIPPVSGG